MPKGTMGIIGVSVSRSNPQNVYAIIESEEGGVFRSRDAGETWEKTSESRDQSKSGSDMLLRSVRLGAEACDVTLARAP